MCVHSTNDSHKLPFKQLLMMNTRVVKAERSRNDVHIKYTNQPDLFRAIIILSVRRLSHMFAMCDTDICRDSGPLRLQCECCCHHAIIIDIYASSICNKRITSENIYTVNDTDTIRIVGLINSPQFRIVCNKQD